MNLGQFRLPRVLREPLRAARQIKDIGIECDAQAAFVLLLESLLQELCARMILEQFGVSHIFGENLNRRKSADILHLEDACAIGGSLGQNPARSEWEA
ncbi:hypothetical protein U1707_07890 [Sphingomonas sp. PB2P12]|uniref:hypothetical protein n=1 Tax=Sphingomonas sandaracina TaxID=3096157 RepID=UPI002FCC89C6